ncbi:MAG: 1-aminocyclopropane-1-carboxylate deaminase [Chitinophagaceae bacterium]
MPDSISVDEISLPAWQQKNILVHVLRLDKIHPVISGNKWFKLKYYLQDAQQQYKNTLVTFGGAYSNHLVATAAAGKLYNFKTIGLVRGEEPQSYSHSLQQCVQHGMELIFLSRDDYRQRKIPAGLLTDAYVLTDAYIINEGGYGQLGAKGAAEILDLCTKNFYTHICSAVGTTTMMVGIIQAMNAWQKMVGISVLKNNTELSASLLNLLPENDRQKNICILHNYHLGGYAQKTAELINFMNEFYLATSIPSDFVYTGKLFFAVNHLISSGFFPAASKILLIHSGGLQGNLSVEKGTLIF